MPSSRNSDSTFPFLDLIKAIPTAVAVFEHRKGLWLHFQSYFSSKTPWKQVVVFFYLVTIQQEDRERRKKYWGGI